VAGAPQVIGAGVDLFRKLGDSVCTGDLLYRVHAEFQSDHDFAFQACSRSTGYTIGRPEDVPHVFVEF
jgi:thymidine phosphorylase